MADKEDSKTLPYAGDDYQEDFDPEGYLQQFWPGCDPENPDQEWIATMMRLIHQLFDSGKYRGKSLLDICSGPSIYSVMSASKYFSKIYLCDFAARNREALQEWIASEPSAHDWSSFFNYVASLEGSSSDAVEHRLRQAVSGVLHCDLRNDLPLGTEQESLAPVDAVLSCFTLEVIVKEDEKLVDYLKKFYSMLSDGGFFMITAVEQMSYYLTAGKKYWARGFTKKLMKDSLLEAGFTEVHFEDILVPAASSLKEMEDSGDFYLCYATKRA